VHGEKRLGNIRKSKDGRREVGGNIDYVKRHRMKK
jgi:hypothetical protein